MSKPGLFNTNFHTQVQGKGVQNLQTVGIDGVTQAIFKCSSIPCTYGEMSLCSGTVYNNLNIEHVRNNSIQ